MYEADFESRVRSHQKELFPDWHFVDFKTNVHAPGLGHGPKQPDFALIHRQYLTWWVVEVELAHHSLDRHIEPQIAVFAHGVYSTRHAEIIARQLQDLDPNRLERLITQVQPGVLVVVNDDIPREWPSILGQYQCSFCVIKAYANELGETAYIVDGDLPSPYGGALCHCRRSDAMSRGIALENPAAVDLTSGQVVLVRTDYGASNFQFALLGNQAFLFAIGGWPFPPNVEEFRLVRTSNGELQLKNWPTKTRRTS